MKNLFIVLILLVFTKIQSQETTLSKFDFSQTQQIVKEKNFYLLAAIEKDPKISNLISQNAVLKNFTKNTISKVSSSYQTKTKELPTLVKAYEIDDETIQAVSNEFKTLVKNEKIFSDFIHKTIRTSGYYANFEKLSDEDFIAESWKLCAKGLNHSLRVYGLGEKPNFPHIDSISYDKKSIDLVLNVRYWSETLSKSSTWEENVFFKPALDFSLALLYLNHRDEAARYEPMEDLENKKVFEYIKKIKFSNYPYTSILVLGAGAKNYRDPITASGKLRLLFAVQEFKAGKAPLIIVSGGHVHPFRTEYAEAIEMKKELMKVYQIPEKCIIVDPHARHTTTNFRNAVRLIFKYHIPASQKSLAVSSEFHIDNVVNEKFTARFNKEFGYVPIELGKRISETAVEFLPLIVSMHQNPLEPLDP